MLLRSCLYILILNNLSTRNLPRGVFLAKSYFPISRNFPWTASILTLACNLSSAREFNTISTPEWHTIKYQLNRSSELKNANIRTLYIYLNKDMHAYLRYFLQINNNLFISIKTCMYILRTIRINKNTLSIFIETCIYSRYSLESYQWSCSYK